MIRSSDMLVASVVMTGLVLGILWLRARDQALTDARESFTQGAILGYDWAICQHQEVGGFAHESSQYLAGSAVSVSSTSH